VAVTLAIASAFDGFELHPPRTGGNRIETFHGISRSTRLAAWSMRSPASRGAVNAGRPPVRFRAARHRAVVRVRAVEGIAGARSSRCSFSCAAWCFALRVV
jgi:hypothetical protein